MLLIHLGLATSLYDRDCRYSSKMETETWEYLVTCTRSHSKNWQSWYCNQAVQFWSTPCLGKQGKQEREILWEVYYMAKKTLQNVTYAIYDPTP